MRGHTQIYSCIGWVRRRGSKGDNIGQNSRAIARDIRSTRIVSPSMSFREPCIACGVFVLKFWEVLFLFSIILVFYWSIINQKIKVLKLTLVACILWIGILVNDRFQRMDQTQICFFQANEPTFVLQNGGQNFCFYANRNKNPKKAKYVAEAFQKVYPGNLHYFEISTFKKTSVNFQKGSIQIEHLKGGYEISLKGKSYFLATSDNHAETNSEIIYSPWLANKNLGNQLAFGAIQFEL
jgi:hypothetical protein